MNNFSWKQISSIDSFEQRINAFVASDKASKYFDWNFRLFVEERQGKFTFRIQRKTNRSNSVSWKPFLVGETDERRGYAARSLWHKLERLVSTLDWGKK